MTIRDLVSTNEFKIINQGEDLDKTITKPFCCDLLSIAMSKAPAGSAWVTVMGNINTLAVASLADVSCIVLAEGCSLDEVATKKCEVEGITVFSTELPIFEAAYLIKEGL